MCRALTFASIQPAGGVADELMHDMEGAARAARLRRASRSGTKAERGVSAIRYSGAAQARTRKHALHDIRSSNEAEETATGSMELGNAVDARAGRSTWDSSRKRSALPLIGLISGTSAPLDRLPPDCLRRCSTGAAAVVPSMTQHDCARAPVQRSKTDDTRRCASASRAVQHFHLHT